MKNNFMNNEETMHFPGLIPDPRSAEQKAKDFQHSELASATPIQWIEKTEYKSFSVRDQDGSSSCVGQGTAKALEVANGVVQSAHPIYARRVNAPALGMYLQNAGDILVKYGTTTEALDVSQLLGEQDMDKPVSVPTPLKIHSYAFIQPNQIDAIAQVLSQGTAVPLTFSSTYEEWQNIPVVNPASTNFWGHCVCAVDFTLYKGEKALIIEDSWGHATSIGNGGQRIITETYLKARCSGAMYFIMNAEIPKPHHKFTSSHPLKYGMTGSPEVVALQNILKYEGFFPPTSTSTGNFMTVTARAVKAWQVAHGIMDYANTTDLTKIQFGNKSMILANSLYGA
jgi:hypothetical protein